VPDDQSFERPGDQRLEDDAQHESTFELPIGDAGADQVEDWNELSERGEELFSALDMGELLMNWGTKPPCEFIFNWSSGC